MWNYRICKEENEAGEYYSIRECYYLNKRKPDKVTAWVVEPCCPVGDTLADLKADFKLMSQALKQPVFEIPKKKGKSRTKWNGDPRAME